MYPMIVKRSNANPSTDTAPLRRPELSNRQHRAQIRRPTRQNSTRLVHLHESSPSTSPTLAIASPDLSLKPPSRISIWQRRTNAEALFSIEMA